MPEVLDSLYADTKNSIKNHFSVCTDSKNNLKSRFFFLHMPSLYLRAVVLDSLYADTKNNVKNHFLVCTDTKNIFKSRVFFVCTCPVLTYGLLGRARGIGQFVCRH